MNWSRSSTNSSSTLNIFNFAAIPDVISGQKLLPKLWNNGILEYWNDGFFNKQYFPIMFFHTLIPDNKAFSHFSRTHFSVIPLFQYSNYPRAN